MPTPTTPVTPVTPVTHTPRGEFTAGLSAVLPMLLGAGFGLWITWQLSCAAGVALGGQIPASWSLDFAGTLTFIAIVVPLLGDRAIWAAMVVAGAVSVGAFALPFKLAIVAAALAGMAAGVLVEARATPAGASRESA